MKTEQLNLLITGVGGQGIILASDIIGDVAISAGLDVKKTDTLGMAQRGGSVISHVKIARKVWSPLIKMGEVDLLLGFEKLEAVRWGAYIRRNGWAIINDFEVQPLSVSLGFSKYPDREEIIKCIKQRTKNIKLVDAVESAKKLGDIRTVNMYMLGCLTQFFNVDINIWHKCISLHVPQQFLNKNIEAFEAGRQAVSETPLNS